MASVKKAAEKATVKQAAKNVKDNVVTTVEQDAVLFLTVFGTAFLASGSFTLAAAAGAATSAARQLISVLLTQLGK